MIPIIFMQLDKSFYLRFKSLNKKWRQDMAEAVDDYCNPFENSFVAKYYDLLFFKKSFLQIKPIALCREKGFRLSRVFECEVVAD